MASTFTGQYQPPNINVAHAFRIYLENDARMEHWLQSKGGWVSNNAIQIIGRVLYNGKQIVLSSGSIVYSLYFLFNFQLSSI